jgi:hypothetical protein
MDEDDDLEETPVDQEMSHDEIQMDQDAEVEQTVQQVQLLQIQQQHDLTPEATERVRNHVSNYRFNEGGGATSRYGGTRGRREQRKKIKTEKVI